MRRILNDVQSQPMVCSSLRQTHRHTYTEKVNAIKLNESAYSNLCVIKHNYVANDCGVIDFRSFLFLFLFLPWRTSRHILLQNRHGSLHILFYDLIADLLRFDSVLLTCIWYGTSQTIREQSTNVSDHFLW